MLEEIPKNSLIDWGNEIDAEQLENAIQALPNGFRSVFVMIETEGFSHKEVAQILKISQGTSKSQLFYAKKRLRETILRM